MELIPTKNMTLECGGVASVKQQSPNEKDTSKRRGSVNLLAEVLGDYARHEEETTLNRHRYEEAMLNVFGSKAVIPPQCEHTGPTFPLPVMCSRHLSNPHFAFYLGIVTK